MLTVRDFKARIIDLQKQKHFDEALEAVRFALAVYPTNAFLLSAEVFLLYKLNRIKEARQIAEERLAFLKNDAFFLKTYLTILAKLGAKSDIEAFIEHHIFARQSGDEDLYVFVAQIIKRLLGGKQAIDAVNRSLSFFPDSTKLRELILNLQKTGDAAGGYSHYREQFKNKKLEDAISEIEQIRVLPGYAHDGELLAYLAELYKKQGDYEKAIGVYQHLLSFQDNEFSRKMLGYAYYKQGNYKSALVYLRDIFLKNPNDHFLYSSIYRIFKETNDHEGLQRLINEALGKHPSAKHLFGLLARAKKWQNDYETS